VIDIDQQQGQWPPSGGGMLDSDGRERR
jgi:hypothetical protein